MTKGKLKLKQSRVAGKNGMPALRSCKRRWRGIGERPAETALPVQFKEESSPERT